MQHSVRTAIFTAVLISGFATGFTLRPGISPARAESGTPSRETQSPVAAGIEPVWQKAVTAIEVKLKAALELYRNGKGEQARKAVTAAQFEGYKNSLLETAVRKHVSQRKDFENNGYFTEIITLLSQGEPAAKIEECVARLSRSLEQDLPQLKLVEGAVSKEMLEEARKRIPEKDWRKVSEELSAAVGGAVGMYARGKRSEALELAKDAYFENYDESGLEAKIDSVNHDANLHVGAVFSTVVRQMEAGEAPERIEQIREELKVDIGEAVSVAGRGHSDGATGFFHRMTGGLRAWFR